jgi:hypothetical protein
MSSQDYPYCYGKLEIVFPMREDGLRRTPEACMLCRYKTGCLRQAMAATEGLDVLEENIDRAYDSGIIGFWERWSKKKNLQRLRQARGGRDRKTKP